MRATAPSGQAFYEGKVSWSAELGFGVRAPEVGQSAELPANEPHEADHPGH
jgi:NADH-quinone oxidoreductase subunit I